VCLRGRHPLDKPTRQLADAVDVGDLEPEDRSQALGQELHRIVVAWRFRLRFLLAMFDYKVLDPRYRNNHITISVRDLMRRELLSLWVEANKRARDSVRVRVARIHGLPQLEVRHSKERRTWYSDEIYVGSASRPSTAHWQSDEASTAAVAGIWTACMKRTMEVLRLLHLDGYEMESGGIADVVWLRETVCLTLDIWTNDSSRADEGCIYIPWRAGNALRCWSKLRSAPSEAAYRLLEDLYELETEHTLEHLEEVREFTRPEKKWHLTFSVFDPSLSAQAYKATVLASAKKALEGHMHFRRNWARRCGALLRESSQRSPGHLALFIAHQVGGLSFHECELNGFSNSLHPAKRAVKNMATLLGLPRRA
jgi:hypothetical protein